MPSYSTLIHGGILATAVLSASSLAAIDTSQLQDIKALKINNDQVITAGLPTEQQFQLIAQAGVKTVINLIPTNNANYLSSEPKIVTDLGMSYHNIEVDWQQPTHENVEQFIQLMQANGDKPVLIHCAANFRASAFYYLYAASKQANPSTMEDTLSPWGDLKQSFAQYPQWQALIEDALTARSND
jgi:uncharacterized protein (TIGR01244 family)